MAINEKFLQEELAVLQADFDKTKKNVENLETVSYTHLTLPTNREV